MTDISESDMLTADVITADLNLNPQYVATNLRGKRGLILLVYSDGCPACRVFKEQSFLKFMNDMNQRGDIVVKALPLHKPGVGQEFNSKVQAAPVKKFEVMYIPTVISFDSQGKYFSTYGSSGPQHQNQYRSIEDLIEYANGVGDYTVDFKVVNSQ